ncbi:MAG: PilT/PilU family type 4a pilus ATPase [Candidatus Desulfofervidus auxilii]|nr:PilT/PilU family type 4a pilus ATPase [Candidatus Desulfofervidus auxilii]
MDKRIVDHIIKRAIETHPELSDILFTPYHPIEILLHGKLHRLNIAGFKKLTPFQIETLALVLIGNRRRLLRDLVKTGSCDLSYQVGHTRLRINIYSQRTGYAMVMRRLPEKVPTIEEMELPIVFKQIAQEHAGIVLFCGPTGSGKSTSIAAILEEINRTRPVHVITLEDPIEFTFTPNQATFNQRELGTDFNDFPTALRAALREAPHVVMVGEIRDPETVRVALNAAETGHLVFSTVHASYTGQAIHRLIDMVSKEEERFIRTRLAGALRWIVCQKLLAKRDGGRFAIFEILKNTLRVQDAIMGQITIENFYDIIIKGAPFGMRTFDQDLIRAYEKGWIDEETALAYATFRSVVRKGIDEIRARRGEKTSDLGKLEIEGISREKFKFL